MAVSLAQAQVNTQDDINFSVIDNLRRYSWLLDHVTFDDTVTPGTGGGSLVYGYTRLLAARAADFRAVNTEYSAVEATRERLTVELKPLGGAFEVDRVLANLGQSATNEVSFQLQQLLTGTRTQFQDELINGDVGVDPNGFDGLDVALTGESTEYIPFVEDPSLTNGVLDWTPGTINSQQTAMAALDVLDDFLTGIVPSHVGGGDQGEPGALPPGVKAILGNTKSVSRVRALARWAGIYTQSRDDLGRQVEMYGPWVLVDVGDKATGSGPIIPIESRDPNGDAAPTTGLTDLYAVSFGLDAFHGASVANSPLVQTWMPDFARAGAVKPGEVEMGPVAPVLRNTRSCGVIRDIKVQ